MVVASRVSAKEVTEERPVAAVKETVSKVVVKGMVDPEKERASKASGGRVRTTTTMAMAKAVEKGQKERKGSRVTQVERAVHQDRCASRGTGMPKDVQHHVQMGASTSASIADRRITKARTVPDRLMTSRQRVRRLHLSL